MNWYFRHFGLLMVLSILPIIIWGVLVPYLHRTYNFNLGLWYAIIFIIFLFLPLIHLILLPIMTSGGFGMKRVLRTGLRAKAKVVRIGELGENVVTIRDQPVLSLELEVNDGIRAPYIVSIDSIIPRAAVPQFQPGAIIPVRVNQKNPKKVVIDLDEM